MIWDNDLPYKAKKRLKEVEAETDVATFESFDNDSKSRYICHKMRLAFLKKDFLPVGKIHSGAHSSFKRQKLSKTREVTMGFISANVDKLRNFCSYNRAFPFALTECNSFHNLLFGKITSLLHT